MEAVLTNTYLEAKPFYELLMDENSGIAEQRDALHNLHDIYAQANGVVAGDINSEDIFLEDGKAVSIIVAAHCLLDVRRTVGFIRGLHAAVQHVKNCVTGRPLHILYAGCGPYATLVLPLTAFFTPAEVQVTLLDVNEHTLNCARHLFEGLGLEDYVKAYVLTDATKYEATDVVDIAVSETMQHALKKEPQVAIMQNLIPQLAAHGVFVPQEIAIDAYAVSPVNKTMPQEYCLQRIYSISKEQCNNQTPAIVPLQENLAGQYRYLYLYTEITTFGRHKLTAMECSLTMPVRVLSLNNATGKHIRFEYIKGRQPGFEHSLLP